MQETDCNPCDPKIFCSCPVVKCPRHPQNHNNGCDPCIKDNLIKGKIPACFFRMVSDDVSDAKDFTVQGFVHFYNSRKGCSEG